MGNIRAWFAIIGIGLGVVNSYAYRMDEFRARPTRSDREVASVTTGTRIGTLSCASGTAQCVLIVVENGIEREFLLADSSEAKRLVSEGKTHVRVDGKLTEAGKLACKSIEAIPSSQ